MNTAISIEQILSDLKRLGSSGISVFGSDFHHFKLLPPLSEEEVYDLEKAYGVTLPSHYREFLIKAGRGGVGPFYGLFEFHHMDSNWEEEPWEANSYFVGNLNAPFSHTTQWNDLTGEPPLGLEDTDEEEYERQWNDFETRYWSPIDGAIPICHRGCALRTWLVISGPEAGNIWNDDRVDYGGMYPLKSGDKNRVSFLQWYRDWLDEALEGLASK